MLNISEENNYLFVTFEDQFFDELNKFLAKQETFELKESYSPILIETGTLIYLIRQKNYIFHFHSQNRQELLQISFFEYKDTSEHMKDHFSRSVRDKWDRSFFQLIKSNEDPCPENNWNKNFKSLRLFLEVQSNVEQEITEKSFLFFNKTSTIKKLLKQSFYSYPLESNSYNPFKCKSIVLDYDSTRAYDIGENIKFEHFTSNVSNTDLKQIIEDLHQFIEDFISRYKLQFIKDNNWIFSEFKSLEFQLKESNIDQSIIDLRNLLDEHQIQIQNTDVSFVKCMVQIQSFLKTKKELINALSNDLKKINFEKMESIDEDIYVSRDEIFLMVNYLKEEFYSFQVSMCSAVSMILAIVRKDALTYFEIYEVFDQNNVFISNWQKSINQHFDELKQEFSTGITTIVNEINQLESNLISRLTSLSLFNENRIDDLSKVIENEMGSIHSTLRFNNLLQIINFYKK